MKKYRLCLVGFGNVGQAFARLLLEKADELETRYGVSVIVTGIITGSHGQAIHDEGLDLRRALAIAKAGGNLAILGSQEAPLSLIHI